jgi:phosphatidylglycerophosphatase A
MKFGQPIWTRFLPTRFVLGIATLGPLGRLPAPGTWGSFAGWLYFIVVFLRFEASPAALGIMTVLLTLLGAYLAVALCGEAEFRLGTPDPSCVILDEFVAMPLCFLGWSRMVGALALFPAGGIMLGRVLVSLSGLALFRFFDILKPLGIARLQRLPGGWGIVADDLAAALAACLVLHLGILAWTVLR